MELYLYLGEYSHYVIKLNDWKTQSFCLFFFFFCQHVWSHVDTHILIIYLKNSMLMGSICSIIKTNVSLLRKATCWSYTNNHFLQNISFHLIQQKNWVQHRKSPQGALDKWSIMKKLKLYGICCIMTWIIWFSAMSINFDSFNTSIVVVEVITLRGK